MGEVVETATLKGKLQRRGWELYGWNYEESFSGESAPTDDARPAADGEPGADAPAAVAFARLPFPLVPFPLVLAFPLPLPFPLEGGSAGTFVLSTT